jgi:hypothetical protein
LATSEPPLGSVMARAMIFSPASTCGTMRALSASEPVRQTGWRQADVQRAQAGDEAA